jgi:hypothetical protein
VKSAPSGNPTKEVSTLAKSKASNHHCFDSKMSTLSKRGQFNVDKIIAKIPRGILEPTSDPDRVNLSMAENHLSRDEVSEIVKTAIAKSLKPEVRHSSVYTLIVNRS